MIAKPIIKDRYWIVTDGTNKVGNVVANSSGYSVTIGENIELHESKFSIIDSVKIKFEQPQSLSTVSNDEIFGVYPTPSVTHNNVFDIKRKMHIFTDRKRGKSYRAAGWFKIKHADFDSVMLCPKYIFLQRYDYLGPFKTEIEALNAD